LWIRVLLELDYHRVRRGLQLLVPDEAIVVRGEHVITSCKPVPLTSLVHLEPNIGLLLGASQVEGCFVKPPHWGHDH